MDNLHVEKVFLVGTHRHSFRPGELAEIVGVVMAKPSGRLCYKVEFGDGVIDYVPLSDSSNFQIVTWEEVLERWNYRQA